MADAIKISGIKCDTPHCNYRDEDVPFEDFPKWINKRCPVCGRNLLTQTEYEQCVKLYKISNKLDRFIHVCRWINPMFYYNKLTGRKPKVEMVEFKLPKRKI